MTSYVALLRGVNVGGNATVSMKELKELCTEIGLKEVRTYINSGNVLFESFFSEATIEKKIAGILKTMTGKDIGVVVRTKAEIKSVTKKNPFAKEKPSQVGVIFMSDKLPAAFKKEVPKDTKEEIHVATREIYIYYPDGMGKSKLKLPKLAETGTMRNMNTVAKLAEML